MWILDSLGIFSCKSYFHALIVLPNSLYFILPILFGNIPSLTELRGSLDGLSEKLILVIWSKGDILTFLTQNAMNICFHLVILQDWRGPGFFGNLVLIRFSQVGVMNYICC